MSSQDSAKQGIKAWLLLLLLTLIWGSSFILIKAGLKAFSPLEVGSLRIIAGGTFLLPIVFRDISKVKKEHWVFLFSVGLIGSLIPAILFAKAETQINSSLAGVINALTPLFVLIIGAIFFFQRILRNQIIGVFIGLLGTILLVLAGSGGNLGELNFYGLFVVAATICYGVNLNIIKYKIESLKAISLTAISLGLVLIPTLLFLLFGTDFLTVMQSSKEAWTSFSAVVLLGIMGTAVALVIFNGLVKLTTPVFAASVTYMIPFVAVMWGIWDGEVLLIGHYIGMIIILGGVYIANLRK